LWKDIPNGVDQSKISEAIRMLVELDKDLLATASIPGATSGFDLDYWKSRIGGLPGQDFDEIRTAFTLAKDLLSN
jgi:hypothetical protein